MGEEKDYIFLARFIGFPEKVRLSSQRWYYLSGMKRTIKDWLIVLVLLLDEAVAVAVVFLALHFFKIQLPLWFIVIIALAFGGFIFVIHKAVIPTFRKKKITGAEGMIGLIGTVIEPLTPTGTVKVNGELWKAKSVDGNIVAGKQVEVIGIYGLMLEVILKDNGKRTKRKR